MTVKTVYVGDSILFIDKLPVSLEQGDDASPPMVELLVDDGSVNPPETREAVVTDAAEGEVRSKQAWGVYAAGATSFMWRVIRFVQAPDEPVGNVISVPTTYPGNYAYAVIDPFCRWASVGGVTAIVGPGHETTDILAAIDAAQALLSSAFCTEIPCNAVPATVSAATAIVAARMLTRPKPGETIVTSETIGDYTYRSPAPQRFEATDLIAEVRAMVYPYLCGWARSEGTIQSPRVWPPEPCCPTCGQWALTLLGGCGCDPLHEYQPDAEGFMRS